VRPSALDGEGDAVAAAQAECGDASMQVHPLEGIEQRRQHARTAGTYGMPQRYGAAVLRPARKTEPANGLHLSSIRQRIESIFWTLKDQLGLERHRARTLHGLRARIASKLLAYSAGLWLNHSLGRPTRAFADLNA